MENAYAKNAAGKRKRKIATSKRADQTPASQDTPAPSAGTTAKEGATLLHDGTNDTVCGFAIPAMSLFTDKAKKCGLKSTHLSCLNCNEGRRVGAGLCNHCVKKFSPDEILLLMK